LSYNGKIFSVISCRKETVMKSKMFLALAWLVIGLATFGANVAYADSRCEDWNYNDPNCPAYLPDAGGRAAFGEAGKPMVDEKTMKSCADWDYNTPGCPGNIREMEGKPAYGEPAGTRTESDRPLGRFCSNEGLNVIETNCPGDPLR
jgi:hypothetical protein